MMENCKQIQKEIKADKVLRERLRAVLYCWSEDESLLLNEGVEEIISVFSDWVEKYFKEEDLDFFGLKKEE